MRKILTYFFIYTMGLLFLSSCSAPQEEKQIPTYAQVKPMLDTTNKLLFKEEMLSIESFIKRRNWDMDKTGTGLYYRIYKPVDSTRARIREGQVARVNYTVYIIDSTLVECYSSAGEPEDFMVGMDNVESGLHEGILFMRKGEKARFILPSHLAFGLVGDMDKIPMHATVVYDIELLDIIDTDQRKQMEKRREEKEKRAEAYRQLQEEQR